MDIKMNVRWLSAVLSNLLWLGITLLCLGFLQSTILTGLTPLNAQTYLALALSIFCCASISDILLAKEPNFTIFNFVVIFLMSVSIVFIFVSHAILPLPFSTASVMIAIVLFIIFKSVSKFLVSNWVYPPFLRTKVMILGDYKHAESIHELIKKSRKRFTLEGVINVQKQNRSEDRTQVTPEEDDDRLYLEAQKAGVKMIIASFPERRGTMPVQQMLKCRMLGIKVVEAQTFYEFLSRKLYIENLKPSDLIFTSGFYLSIRRRFIKRAFDIFCSVIGLLIFAPFFPFVALLIHLDSPGPIFFRQIRMGRDDKLFHIIKFRSMRSDAEKSTGAVWAVKEDPRITRIGSFLRKSRIDEIPQLINVLQGEMSLVGPRPERPEFISELKKSIPYYAERHHLKPGVTGWAQVCYPYGASVEDALEKLRYDLYYIKKQSFIFDIEIILRTVLIVFTRNGAR